MEVRKITELEDFVKVIRELNSQLIRSGTTKNEHFLFRGQPNEDYELLPAIGRNRRSSLEIGIFNEEENLIELAKIRCPEIFRSDMQPIELLALLQHYGIPTRLLDVTENAFAALFFACESDSNRDKNGEVIVFKHNEKEVATAPIINAIAESYRSAPGGLYTLALFFDALKRQPYATIQNLDAGLISENEKEDWIKECCDKVQFVYAPVKSLRQKTQFGRYILFPNKIEKESALKGYYFESIIDPIPKEDNENIAARLIVPKQNKARILEDLRWCGVTRSFLFADNIDIVCEEIVKECNAKCDVKTDR